MLAMAFKENGEADVIQPLTFPDPDPGPTEVVVQVNACALNHLDIWMRKGLPYDIPMPHISGSDVAGVIVDVGELVKRVQVGDSVLIAPGIRCGACAFCLRGQDSLCAEYKTFGLQTQGGFAELTKVDQIDVLAIDDSWSYSEWAAVPLAFQTAWNMVHRQGCVSPSDFVLVHSAGSGVGSAAIQIAKLAGAQVITTASSDKKIEAALRLGADYGVNYGTDSFLTAVRDITSGRGVDLVIEHVGQAVWKDSLKCLAPGGVLVTCGATSGPKVDIDLRVLFTRQLRIAGAHLGAREDLLKIIELVQRRELQPVVDRVFPLAEAAAAESFMEQRAQFGKIVLQP